MSVLACQAFKKGDCRLVPAGGTFIAVDMSNHEQIDGLNSLTSMLQINGDLITTHSFHLTGHVVGDVVVPALCLQSTHEPSHANRKVSMYTRTVSVTNADSSTISLPVFVNTKAIKEGDELLYFKPKGERKKDSQKRPFDLI